MTTKNGGPQFVHDCANCVFLGRYTTDWDEPAGSNYDLYVCVPQGQKERGTVLARYGDEAGAYASGAWTFGLPDNNPRVEAMRRAAERGFFHRVTIRLQRGPDAVADCFRCRQWRVLAVEGAVCSDRARVHKYRYEPERKLLSLVDRELLGYVVNQPADGFGHRVHIFSHVFVDAVFVDGERVPREEWHDRCGVVWS